MGEMSVDDRYKKFMEYVKYCPDDVPTEEKKMQRFELGLVKRCKFTSIAADTPFWMLCTKELHKLEA